MTSAGPQSTPGEKRENRDETGGGTHPRHGAFQQPAPMRTLGKNMIYNASAQNEMKMLGGVLTANS